MAFRTLLVLLFAPAVVLSCIHNAADLPVLPISVSADCAGKVDEFDNPTPYCIRVNGDLTAPPVYECRRCVSSCDCPLNEFCTKLGSDDVGLCQKPQPETLYRPCFPFDGAELINTDFEEDTKCAELYSTRGQTLPNFAGYCRQKVCQFCDPSAGTHCFDPSDTAYPLGMGPIRACVFPGEEVDAHISNWAIGYYRFNAVAGFQALFFVFFMMMLACQTVRTVYLMK